MQARAAEQPRELLELSARIERLRERLKKDDPDLTADELLAAIERAEGKRRDFEAQQPAAKASQVLSMLPKTAEMFGRKVALGLDGDAAAALKARSILREMVGGRIDLKREGEELWAEYSLQPGVLLQVVGNRGSGGVIWAVPSMPQAVRLK
jgi:hypothetical protein